MILCVQHRFNVSLQRVITLITGFSFVHLHPPYKSKIFYNLILEARLFTIKYVPVIYCSMKNTSNQCYNEHNCSFDRSKNNYQLQ